LIIFANWRGFSGGLRDLFEQILKFGSYIVDNLRQYKQPVFIYIPPYGELRGGAWVVLDPTINLQQMEMYCDENGRGGVLEPNGTIEIKYRDKDQLTTMHRLDSVLKELDSKLLSDRLGEDDRKEIQRQIAKREDQLRSIYEQLAIYFADLHDTAGRMKAKGVISEVLRWETSRQFFYHRVKRRMAEEYLRRQIVKMSPNLSYDQVTQTIKSWIKQTEPNQDPDAVWSDNTFISSWLERTQDRIKQLLKTLHKTYISERVSGMLKEDPVGALEGILVGLQGIERTPEMKVLVEKIQKRISKVNKGIIS